MTDAFIDELDNAYQVYSRFWIDEELRLIISTEIDELLIEQHECAPAKSSKTSVGDSNFARVKRQVRSRIWTSVKTQICPWEKLLL